MKFAVGIFSALLLGGGNVVSAQASKNNKKVNMEDLMSKVNVDSLMRHAVKVEDREALTQNHRKMADENFQLSGDHSIQFSSCVSIKTQPYDYDTFYGEYNLYAAQNGQLVSENSFVLFNVCETDKTCSYDSEENLYMVDLRTFVRTTMSFYPTKQQNYCQACLNSQDYCEYVS